MNFDKSICFLVLLTVTAMVTQCLALADMGCQFDSSAPAVTGIAGSRWWDTAVRPARQALPDAHQSPLPRSRCWLAPRTECMTRARRRTRDEGAFDTLLVPAGPSDGGITEQPRVKTSEPPESRLDI
jgi:hypothetical protein